MSKWAGSTTEAFVHVPTIYLEGKEAILICNVCVKAELVLVVEKTHAGKTRLVGERVRNSDEEFSDFISS